MTYIETLLTVFVCLFAVFGVLHVICAGILLYRNGERRTWDVDRRMLYDQIRSYQDTNEYQRKQFDALTKEYNAVCAELRKKKK